MDVTVSIAAIPSRMAMLGECLWSVTTQTLRPAGISVHVDHHGEGASVAKNRALSRVATDWVAFVDDDDLLLPHHLEALAKHQQQTDADVVWSNYRVEGGRDPHHRIPRTFDPDLLRRAPYIPTTMLCRTQLALGAGGFQRSPWPGPHTCDEHGLQLAMLDAGATFACLDEITWVWRHHGKNTSGEPWKKG